MLPPVGLYNNPRCALELLKRTTAVKKSPFGITAVRFTPNHKKCSTPGQYVWFSMCFQICCMWLLFKMLLLFHIYSYFYQCITVVCLREISPSPVCAKDGKIVLCTNISYLNIPDLALKINNWGLCLDIHTLSNIIGTWLSPYNVWQSYRLAF